MEGKNYYSLTTKCFTLRCHHPEWLISTQQFYNQILLFYYNLFLDCSEKKESKEVDEGGRNRKEDNEIPEKNGENPSGNRKDWRDSGKGLADMNTQQLLRELERRTIVGRDKEPVPNPLPWDRVPLYFRRAAANAGIAAGRSYLSREEQQQRAECFHESVTFYKGTYRDFDQAQITLKVWTGEAWVWLRCRLSGNEFSDECLMENGVLLSPCVVVKPKGIYLHVPVRERVKNGSNAKKRMAEGSKICSVQFTNGDSIAVCVVLNSDNSQASACFLKGGSQYSHSCNRILDKLEKSRGSTMGQKKQNANQKYWLKLKNLSISYAHQVSRQIVDFAGQESCEIIVLPKYDEQYKSIVMKTVGNWSALRLSSRIRTQISYKAWQRGILVLEVNTRNTSSKCSACGAPVKKDGREYICTNGHRGSRYVNTAVNLGKKCRDSFAGQR